VQGFWEPTIGARCIHKQTWLVFPVFNILTDVTTVVLPLPVLTRLQLPIRQKIGVCF
jgi:hypothetical protein